MVKNIEGQNVEQDKTSTEKTLNSKIRSKGQNIKWDKMTKRYKNKGIKKC